LPSLVVDNLKTHKKEQAETRLKPGPAYENNDLVPRVAIQNNDED